MDSTYVFEWIFVTYFIHKIEYDKVNRFRPGLPYNAMILESTLAHPQTVRIQYQPPVCSNSIDYFVARLGISIANMSHKYARSFILA